MQQPTESQCEQLREQGFVLLPGFASTTLVAQLQRRIADLFATEGGAAGAEFKQEVGARRLANVVNKGEIFLQLLADPLILGLVRDVLGADMKLSSLNVRVAEPQNQKTQPLHCDMGAVPDEQGYWVCNVVWMLDAFTADNGALRVVPGSHRKGKLPQQEVADLTAPHPDEYLITGPVGSVVVLNAHLWHSGLANRTDQPRTAVHAFYCRGDKPQQQYQKRLLDPAVQALLSGPLRRLLALDDPRNDALSEQLSPRSGFLE